MLAVISPAKSLDFERTGPDVAATEPVFQEDAVRLAKTAKQLPLKGLRALMSISDDLARLNKARFEAFAPEPTAQNAKQAALAFNGDTYQGLKAWTMNGEDLDYAQDHLRILSGLYGVLRPLDMMQPYRLEMGSRLKTRRGNTLYDYWRDQIAKELDQTADGAPVINLASNEYFKAAKAAKMKSPVVTCHFHEERDGALKTIGFFAKNARGSMARYMIDTRAGSLDDLRGFDRDGYGYRADLSDAHNLVFSRPPQD